MRTKLVVIVSRLRDFAFRRRLDRELEVEIREHLSLLKEELLRRGLSEREAAKAARAQFGSVQRVRDDHWESRGFAAVDALIRDLRFAVRFARHNIGLSAAAVVTLGLAIAVNSTVFSVVNATRLRGLPVEAPERVVAIRFAPDDAGRSSGVSFRDFEDFSAADELEAVGAFSRSSFTVSGDERAAQQVQGLYISASGFSALGTSAAVGRYLSPADDSPGAPPVVVLGDGVWHSRFDGDPDIVGRTVRVNGTERTVIGVMPEGFAFDFYADLWLPLAQMPGLDREHREARALELVARLDDGATPQSAQASLRALGTTERAVFVQPFTGTLTGDPTLMLLLLAAAFVLAVACANVAGLLFSRAAHRSREVAFRVSLGATRWQIARQLLVESAFLALIAGTAGFVLSLLGVRAFASAIEGIARPYWIHFGLDGRVVWFLIAVTSTSLLLFGLAPALVLARGRHTRRVASGTRLAGSVLAIAELGLTLVLLSSAGLMMRSFLSIYETDRTIDTSRLTTLGLRLPETRYRGEGDRILFFQQLDDVLRSLDTVGSHAVSSTVPFANAAAREIEVEGRPRDDDAPPAATIAFLTVTPGYFETLGIDLSQGRDFDARDGAPGYEHVIVNEALASRYFPGEGALEKRLRLIDPRSGEETAFLSIVGVAPTLRHRRFQPEPTVYLPYRHAPSAAVRLIVRAADGRAVVPSLRDAVRELDPELPLFAFMTGEELRTQSRWPYRVIGGMLTAFAIIALVIAAVGLYAVTAHAVSKRTHELGIRRALGARSGDVIWLVARPVAAQLAAGAVVGGLGALAAGRLLASFLVDTSSSDPVTLGTVLAVLSAVTLTAGLMPARSAARLDPAVALRHE